MLPAFRPDRALLTVNQPAGFNEWVEGRLGQAANVEINGFPAFPWMRCASATTFSIRRTAGYRTTALPTVLRTSAPEGRGRWHL